MEPTVTSLPTDAEQRSERRQRTLKGGRIILPQGLSVFSCTVRNLSPSGALLAVPSMLGIPSHFDLALDGMKDRRPCTVQWHTDRLIGVHFDDAT